MIMMADEALRERLCRFAKLVADGAKVFAGPETAKRMNELLEEQGLDTHVEVSMYMEDDGTLYAVDMKKYGF